MNKKQILSRSKAILPIVISVILLIYFISGSSENTDNAYVEADISVISSEITGKIKEIKFEENQSVEKDQILIHIDDETYNSKLILAQADFDSAKEEEEKAIISTQQASYNINKAQNDLSIAEADFVKSSADYKRETSLSANNIASKQRYESSLADFSKAQSTVGLKKISLINAKSDLDIKKIESNLCKIRSSKASANLDMAKRDLANTIIRAPFAGYVSHKMVELSNLVRPATPLIYMIPKENYIIANLKESQIANIRIGQKVKITLDAFPKSKLNGEVENISRVSGALFSILPPENATGNFTKIVQRYPVKIKFTDFAGIDQLIKPGLSAEVKIGINRR